MYTRKKHFFIIILPCLVTLFSGCGGGGSGNQASGTTLVANIPKNISENASVSGSVELKNLNDFNAKDLDSLKITDSVSGAKNCKQTIILTYEHNIVANTLYRIAMKAPDEAPCQHKLSFSINDKPISTSEINVVVPYITGKVAKGLPPSTQAGAVYPVTFEFKNTNPNHSATGVTISPPPSDFTETTNTCKIDNATLAPNSTCVIQGNFSPQIGKSAQLSYTLSYAQGSSVTLTTSTTVSPRLFILSSAGAVIHYNLDKNNSLVNPQLSTLFVSPQSIALTSKGSKAFITNLGNNTVIQCDVNNGVFSQCKNTSATRLSLPTAITLTADGKKAFIINTDLTDKGIVIHCDVNLMTGIFSNCHNAHATGLSLPSGITLTKGGSKAFIVNSGNNTVSQCDVSKDGMFSNCQDTGNIKFDAPSAITLTADGLRAFIANAGIKKGDNGKVSRCDVSDTGVLSHCQDAGGSKFNGPTAIILTKDESKAFITNFGSNTVTQCDVNTLAGTFSNCHDTNGAGFYEPFGIVLTADDSKAFIANSGNNTVSRCDVNNKGTFSNCTYIAGSKLNNSSTVSAFVLTADGSKAFIVNSGNNTVSQCDVSKDGMFSNCQNTGGSEFDKPTAITLTKDGSKAFIANSGNNTVSRCDVRNGTFSNCQNTGSGFDTPSAIALTADGSKAFVASFAQSTIRRCDVNIKAGTLANCEDTGDIKFYNPSAIALTADGSTAFIANYTSNSIIQCSVNNGDFYNCHDAHGTGINAPSAIALTADGSKAFIANQNTISQCDINKYGNFSNCQPIAPSVSDIVFGNLIGVALR
ncbi:beta-propeller fold lactonase family protein [Cysteiniphilum halobium]|uniref:beta-propeller fold lactonase family protein n=1 Tax=Cysteiniphilum halobium TaxID=2219059 RepID=UPI000E65AD8E|nr:beta-propeller fold lactonase family protein [Cysteiniphilum halobium]